MKTYCWTDCELNPGPLRVRNSTTELPRPISIVHIVYLAPTTTVSTFVHKKHTGRSYRRHERIFLEEHIRRIKLKGNNSYKSKSYEQQNMSNLNQSLTMIKRKCQQN